MTELTDIEQGRGAKVAPSDARVQQAFNENEDSGYGCCGWVVIILSGLLFVLIFPIAFLFSVKTIKEYERGIILRLGRCVRDHGKSAVLQPGMRFILPCTDNLLKVSLRTQSFNIPPQDVLTKDAVSCNVDAIVYLRIVDAARAMLVVEDSILSAKYVAISALRNVIGQFDLSELMQERERIDEKLKLVIDEATDPWGILVERVDIKDVSLPEEMQRAMAAEAQAARQAKAKVISAQGELDASEALASASARFDQSPSSLHLRYLQTVTTIAAERNSTILFPLPMELLRMFSK